METEMNRLFATALVLMASTLASLTVATAVRAQNAEPAPVAAPVATPAVAPANPDCAAQASDKKLAGAALNSFMKKCARDAATTSCDVAAEEKKLKGAAKKSFTKKCIKDAIITQ